MININKLSSFRTALKNICKATRVCKSHDAYFHVRIFSRFLSTKCSATAPEVAEKDKAGNQMKLIDIPLEDIRNFSIIAHVDHGKSTLADRLLEVTGTVAVEHGKQQILDSLQVERERGITVKAQTVSIQYTLSGKQYLLNLIDTPGHVDFSNEVSRSLAACQGVVLLVDANDGVQAQTVANFYLAFTKDLEIIPVLNKIDLKNANPDAVALQLQNLFGIVPKDVVKISAKLGTGVDSLLEAIVKRVPPPPADRSAPLRALIFDSWYDRYRGAVALIYVRDGQISVGDEVTSVHSGKTYMVKNIGLLRPQEESTGVLYGGQVGWVTCNMRSTKEAHIGDTLHHKGISIEPLPDFAPAKSMVFAGVYPMDQSEHVLLRSAIEKLALNDPAVSVTVDSSPALGQGWRLGFLGLLHMEVFNQRLEQEHGAQAIITAPSVTYKVTLSGKSNIKKYGAEEIYVSNPTKLPDPTIIAEMYEPVVLGTIITPGRHLGDVLSLCMDRRGVQKSSSNIDNETVLLQFMLPLNEIIVDFHDSLKSVTSGFASFDYEDQGYSSSTLVKLNILLNGVVVDELSTIVHITKAVSYGKRMCAKLLDIIPRQQFQVAIQAAVGGKIVARENLKAFRKDVTAKLYGGDVTRRMKLLKQQADGKKRLKKIANIDLPRETFIDVLKR